MSNLNHYIRQLKPRNESYSSPVEKIQNFLTEASTKDATDMENVIVACWNNRIVKKLDKKKFDKQIVKTGNKYKIKDTANNDVLYEIPSRVKPDQLWEFARLLEKNAPSKQGTMLGAGKEDPPLSAFWYWFTGKIKDTSKADIMLGKQGISVKGVTARLMSGIAEESIATAHAAFTRASGGKGLTDVQNEILKDMENMIGSSDRIDIENPVADERSSRTAGQLSVKDAKKYGITYNKKTDKFVDDRWITSQNLKAVEDPNRGEGKIDWDNVTYETKPKFEDKDNKETKAIIARMNTAAGRAVAAAKEAKGKLETALTAQFNQPNVKLAFAWEAMSGWDKFNNNTGPTADRIHSSVTGLGGTGYARQMLVWDWGLKKMAWHKLSAKSQHVKKIAGAISPKFDLKSNSYKQTPIGKVGYAFDLTLQFAVKYIESSTKSAELEVEEKTHKAKQMLAEGQLDEFAFWDKVKKIWNTFISTVKIYWDKFVNMLKEIKDKIVEVFDAGINSVLAYFDIGLDVQVNTTVKLL